MIALVVIVLLPAVSGLPRAGQVMLAILAFAVIIWMTEALDYAVSAVVIGALMVFLLAYAPDAAKPLGPDMGTSAALGLALSGFSNSAVALVAAACFIAAAMTATGLDRRIALLVLSKVDANTNHTVIGAMVVGFMLSFIVPNNTARVACLVPIMMGFILAFKVEKRSRLAGDHRRTDCQRVERRDKNRRCAKHGGYWLYGKAISNHHHVGPVVYRRGTVFGASQRGALLHHDAHDAT